ncbi:Trichodiene oxygenase [Podospora fimiseda]|uniref:Trichodiene oxygenase n=1 Tax=Podospora fimiseda TaxID=252190 RepID=A0AAN7BH22_9PEZI|nr:Trichodiene oxygenase [Podospora fimiseda]
MGLSLSTLSFGGLVLAIGLVFLYQAAKPKPLPGIPYVTASADKLLGDVPAVLSHVKETDGTLITYILEQMRKLNTPIMQVFVRPLSKPLVIIGDFHEMHDVLIHRHKDFDRAELLGNLVKGLAPDHHIQLKTNDKWKHQRRLIQDLMTPTFLHKVAGPALHSNISRMVDLWREKARIANGRPWPAAHDINHVALDAVMGFAFGDSSDHSATRPALEVLRGLNSEQIAALRGFGNQDEPITFPTASKSPVLGAILELTGTVNGMHGNPWPALAWAYVMRKPRIKRAVATKEAYISTQLSGAVRRLTGPNSEKQRVSSALDHMIVSETKLAGKDGRAPDYFSRAMVDEIFGFVFAGHETTSTTLCWGLKNLTDNPAAQTKLRQALENAFPAAYAEGRDPTAHEITSTHVPYLDATMEEILRCAGTAPLVDRQATRDTELLGYQIPKGTIIAQVVLGPTLQAPGVEIRDDQRSPTSRAALKDGRTRSWDPSDMGRFNPDRWMVPGAKGEEFDPTAGPQIAFGLGTRGCYGKRLVYVEMRMVISLILWNFELVACPPKLSSNKAILITTNEPRQCFQGSPYTKDPKSYTLGVSKAMAFTLQADKHKIKRQALEPAFSKRRVNMMEDGLFEELDLVFDRINNCEKEGSEVPISELFYCYTGDIISRYLFGKSLDLISSPDYLERAEQMRSFTRGVWFAIHFKWVRDLALNMPRFLGSVFNDAWVSVLWFCEDLAKNAIDNFDDDVTMERLTKPGRETIYDRLLSDHHRRQKKGLGNVHPLTVPELADDSVAMLNAGTEPTATMLVYALYFFKHYPEVQKRVLEELASIEPDENGRLPLAKIENLPYFTGFVKETLRYVPLVPGRLPRKVPKGGLFVPAAQTTIPEGAIVGIDHMPLHMRSEVFEHPTEFDPERWIGEQGKELNYWLLSFSKGRTDCIGKNLAFAEMHIVLANMFAKYEVELMPGSDENMVWLDRVIVHPVKNLRIKVKTRDTPLYVGA